MDSGSRPSARLCGQVQLDRPAGLERPGQLGRADRLDPDNPDRRLERGHGCGDARDQAATAHRDQDGLDLRAVLQDLEAAGSLAGDDIQALVRRHHGQAPLLGQRHGSGIPLGRAVAGNDDLAALALDSLDLDRPGPAPASPRRRGCRAGGRQRRPPDHGCRWNR